MSNANTEEEVKEQVHNDDDDDDANKSQSRVDEDPSMEELKDSDKTDENSMPSLEQEEESIKNKYGGMLPKKKPLISKDHERAFFDSADWALGKQGAQKPKGPLEALRPKLQPTPPHQVRSRRSPYAPADDCDDVGSGNASSEDENRTTDGRNHNPTSAQDQSSNV